jgi:hypothetical protein
MHSLIFWISLLNYILNQFTHLYLESIYTCEMMIAELEYCFLNHCPQPRDPYFDLCIPWRLHRLTSPLCSEQKLIDVGSVLHIWIRIRNFPLHVANKPWACWRATAASSSRSAVGTRSELRQVSSTPGGEVSHTSHPPCFPCVLSRWDEQRWGWARRALVWRCAQVACWVRIKKKT